MVHKHFAAAVSAVLTLNILNFPQEITAEENFAEEAEKITASYRTEGLSSAVTEEEKASLPERFDLREKGLVSAVKNQGSYGTCWTFAASGALETSLIKSDPFIDLSELHLAYFSFYGDDTPTNPENDPEAFISGGHISYAAASYARWTGPVREALLPYDTSEEDIDINLKDLSEYFVTDINMINQYALKDTSPDDMIKFSDEEIKQMLLEENAVAVNIRYENTCNPETAAQYDPSNGKTNHGVLIVGWDDSFSRDNFLETPPGDGAWIVKNSWGDSWGDNGYFYVSYYDRSLSDACCLKAENTGRYDTNYQHDSLFYTAAISPDYENRNTGYMANIFTAKKDEYISGAGFYTTDNGTEYEITVYTGLENLSDPTSGTPNNVTCGTEKYAGYHTVSLIDPVKVSAGEKFSVVASLTNPENACSLPVEAAVVLMENSFPENVSDITKKEIRKNSDYGESFISATGTRWTDTKGLEIEDVYDNPMTPDTNIMYYVGNVCLKAFGSETVSEPENDRISSSVLSSLTVNGEAVRISDDEGKPVTEIYSEITGTKDYAVLFPSGTGKITVNGKAVTSGHESEQIPLEYGENTIVIVSEEEGLKTTEYTVTVKRNRVCADYRSETLIADDENTVVTAEDGTILKNGDSISEYLGDTLTVNETDNSYTLELASRRDLAASIGENALVYGSEGISRIFSFKGDMVFSTSPDMSNPQPVKNRLMNILSDNLFKVYPGYDRELYFQILAGDDAPESTIFHISIPERPAVEGVEINVTDETSFSFTVSDTGTRTDWKADVKYSNDALSSSAFYGAKTIKEETTPVTDLVPGQTYSLYIKRYSTDSEFASDIKEYIVKLPGNEDICSFNYEKERIIFDEEIYTAGAEDGTEFHCYDIISEYCGENVVLTDAEGNETTVKIPSRRKAPQSEIDYEAGRLTGTFDSSIKFVTNCTYAWQGSPVESKNLYNKDGVITLESLFSSIYQAGTRLNFFYAATENEFASEMCTIVVPSQDSISKDTVKVLSYTADTICLEAHEGAEYGYRTAFSEKFTWQDDPVIEGLTPGTRYILAVRYKATEDRTFSRSAGIVVTTLSDIYTAGDMNGDGNVNAADVIILRKILLMNSEADAFQRRGADINGDGRVNVFDLQRQRKHIV